MYTNNYFDIERFDKVIAKIKWCSFCVTVHIICLYFCILQNSIEKYREHRRKK